MKCKNCDGNGEVKEWNFGAEHDAPLTDIVICRFCKGTGEVE